jgi:2'-5' RNA ligase
MFVAVNLSPEAREQVAKLQARLQTGCRFVDAHPKWVPAENFHLTLVFLGSLPDEAIPYITDVTDAIAERTSPFELGISRVELFPPDTKQAKVISANIKGDRRALISLHGFMAEALDSAGFEIERRVYQPHLTLARLTSAKTADRVAKLVTSHTSALQVAFAVNEVVLYESVTKSSGPVYEPLHVSKFQG